MLEILFLGTGGSIPSRNRSSPCIAVKCESNIILLDCGEGSQRQMMISPFSFMKVNGIFITHMHGDHVFGLPGLIQTMGMSGRKNSLTVCGPEGFKDRFEKMLYATDDKIPYPLEICDLMPGDQIVIENLTVTSYETKHVVKSVGYVVEEKESLGRFDKEKAKSLGIIPGPDFSKLQKGISVGKVTPEMVMGPKRPGCKIVYTGDTSKCESTIVNAESADVLIHESTYSNEDESKAEKYGHSTAKQAAQSAKKTRCKFLILTHISNRYSELNILLDEAKEIFADVVLASDMDVYKITKVKNSKSVELSSDIVLKTEDTEITLKNLNV